MKRILTMAFCAFALAATMTGIAGCASPDASSSAASDSASTASSASIQSDQASSVEASLSSASPSTASTEATQFKDIPDKMSSDAANSANQDDGDSKLAMQLEKDIRPIVKNAGMDVGVYVIDPESDTHVSINGDKSMVSASMIKLVIAASLLEKVDAGDLALDDTYTIKESDIVGGTGSLGGRGAGAEVTYDELLELMISESDNTAANILIDELDMNAVNKTAKDLGLKSTKLNRLMMDEDAIAKGVENYTSAEDVARILELVYQDELVSKKASALVFDALRKQLDDSGILAGLPSEATFAHKTGSLGVVQHDGGIVECDHDFILVVMCGGNGFSLDGALETMKEIGEVAYEDIA